MGEKAIVDNADPQREEEGESEEEVSEDDSPRKHNFEEVTQVMARSARIQYGNASYRDLSAELKNLEEEERKEKIGED